MGHRGAEAQREHRGDPLTGQIIGAAIEVHRWLGPGLLETAYEECLAWELRAAGLRLSRQVLIPLIYKGLRIENAYRIDLIVDEKVLVELKHVEQVTVVHQAQVLTYLRLTGLRTALLINFNTDVLRDGIRRFVL
jgi:GxxExxY protein